MSGYNFLTMEAEQQVVIVIEPGGTSHSCFDVVISLISSLYLFNYIWKKVSRNPLDFRFWIWSCLKMGFVCWLLSIINGSFAILLKICLLVFRAGVVMSIFVFRCVSDGKFMRELCYCSCFVTAFGMMGFCCLCLRQNTLVSVVGCLLAETLNWFSRTMLLTDFRVQCITSFIYVMTNCNRPNAF